MDKLFRAGTISLLALISGCYSPPKKVERNLIEASQIKKPVKEPLVEIVPFLSYDPPKATSQLLPESKVINYVTKGLDFNLEPNERVKIGNYFEFKNLIYSTAMGLGYSENEVREMSPKEAIKLACDLVAHRTNYFGTTQDHETIFRKDKFMWRMRQNLLAIIGSADTPDQQRLNATKKIEQLKAIENKGIELEILERQIRDDPGYMVIVADEVPVDILFKGEEPIVCRHFAEITKGVFLVLKQDNHSLSNTWVSSYSDRNHRWNQVTTLTGKGYVISFFDPTWHDLRSEIEGYDGYHFPDTQLLEAQLNNFEGKKILRSFSNN